MIDVDSGVVRWITHFPAWHAAPDDAGDASSATPIFPTAACTSIRARRRSGRRGRAAVRQRGVVGGHALGRPVPLQRRAGRGRSRPAHPSASALFAGRLARAVHLRPHRLCSALRSDAGGDAMTAPPCWKASASARKSATAASPAPAAGSRMASCNAISRSCRRHYAFDFLLYCQRNQRACPVLEVTDPGSSGAEASSRRRRPAHRLRALRDLSRRRARRGPHRHPRPVARRSRHVPDRLRHHHRRRAGARRRADPQGPLGAAHHHADRAGRSVPRRPDRHHALADRAAGASPRRR